MVNKKVLKCAVSAAMLGYAWNVGAATGLEGCADIDAALGSNPRQVLYDALVGAVAQDNGGLGNHMWLTVVDNAGVICHVVNSESLTEPDITKSWLASRVISAQKAFTATSLSVVKNANPAGTNIALSTANLYTATQPGGSLYGLQFSNPVNPDSAYHNAKDTAKLGTGNAKKSKDPLVAPDPHVVGGVNVFGGGFAIYSKPNRKLGGIGVSGDTSCTDHVVGWKVRDALKLDNIPGGVVNGTDNMSFDLPGWAHPSCGNDAIVNDLPNANPLGS